MSKHWTHTEKLAKLVYYILDVRKQGFSEASFIEGFKVEMEHKGTVKGDSITIGHIVLDHLDERKDYYSRLKKAGL